MQKEVVMARKNPNLKQLMTSDSCAMDPYEQLFFFIFWDKHDDREGLLGGKYNVINKAFMSLIGDEEKNHLKTTLRMLGLLEKEVLTKWLGIDCQPATYVGVSIWLKEILKKTRSSSQVRNIKNKAIARLRTLSRQGYFGKLSVRVACLKQVYIFTKDLERNKTEGGIGSAGSLLENFAV